MQTTGSVRRRVLTNGGNAIAGEERPEHEAEKLPDFPASLLPVLHLRFFKLLAEPELP